VVSWLAIGAAILFGLAVVLLAAFFRTRDERLDQIATWSFVVFAVLVIPVMLAVRDRIDPTGPVGIGLTALGVLGASVLGVAEAATGLRLVDFRRVATATTIAFVLFLVWIGATSLAIVAGPSRTLPLNLGWLGIASIVAGIAVIAWITRQSGVMTGEREPSQAALTAFFLPLAGIVAWLGWLGLQL
jgi:hypothetical protein